MTAQRTCYLLRALKYQNFKTSKLRVYDSLSPTPSAPLALNLEYVKLIDLLIYMEAPYFSDPKSLSNETEFPSPSDIPEK